MVKNSSSQTGSAHVITIVGLIVLLIGALGFIFWQNFINKEPITTKTETQTVQKEDKKSDKDQPIDTSIHAVNIKMQSESEVSKLPDYTPASFKTYIRNLLEENNVAGNDCDAAIPEYQISKISQVNIQGGVVPVTKDDQACPGGAPAIWVLAPSGTWDKETLNGPACKSKGGGLIYEEFVPECYIDSDTNSFVKNPNGSITSLNN